MSFITETDLLTGVYAEQLDAITRQDDTVPQFAIDAAEEEAKGYLSPKYNVTTMFALAGADRPKVLVLIIRDIAIYNMLSIANPGIDYKSRKDLADRAIEWLKRVQAGKVNPPSLTLAPVDEEKNEILMSSNTKRTQHY